MNQIRLFTGNFISACIIQLGTSNCFYVLMAVLPLYAASELNLSKAQIGLITGAFSITCVILRPLAGACVDGAGRLKVYRPAILLFSICIGAHIFAANFISILILRIFQGAVWGFIGTAGPTVAADIVPPGRRAEGLAYYYLFMSLGMALGPAVGIFMLNYTSYDVVFAVFAVLAFLAWAAAWRLKLPLFTPKKISLSIRSLFERRVLNIALMLGFYGVVFGGLLTFSVLHGQQNDIQHAGLFYLFFAVTMAITRPVGGSLLDRNGPGHILGFGLLMMIIGFFMLAFTERELSYFVSALILGVGAGTVLPPLAAMTINVVPPERRGAANATSFTAMDIGTGLGSVILGFIADKFSISVMFAASAVLLLFPLFYYYSVFRSRYKFLTDKQRLS